MIKTGKSRQGPSTSCADIEIFAGAGGMTLGLQKAGFQFSHVFEIDPHTCETLENNHSSKGGLIHGEVIEEDVSKLNWKEFKGSIRLLAGGAPCQPFSLAGRHLADKDDRNMFPEVLRAMRSLWPYAVLDFTMKICTPRNPDCSHCPNLVDCCYGSDVLINGEPVNPDVTPLR